MRRRDRKEVFSGFWWGNPSKRRQLGKPRWKWEYSIIIELKQFFFNFCLIFLRTGTSGGSLLKQ